MAFTTPVASLVEGLGTNGGTSSSINTTGANFLVLAVSYGISVISVSDSKSNTWTPLTEYGTVSTAFNRIYYVENPTVGSGHTFTVTGTNTFPGVAVDAWAGALTSSVFDQQNGNANAASVTSIQPGSVTPGSNDQLVVTTMTNFGDPSNSSRSINGGFTISGQVGNPSGTNYPVALAYLVQTSAAAANPTWSWSAGNPCATAIATFKPSVGGDGGTGWGALLGGSRNSQIASL